MFVSATLEGTVVTAPARKSTRQGVPVANFAVSTKEKTRGPGGVYVDGNMITWVVAAYAELAVQVLDTIRLGQSVVVTGSLSASEPFTGSDGIDRLRIEMRAQSVAPNYSDEGQPPVIVLRGAVASTPELDYGTPVPQVDVDVRTSRFRRGDVADEADVTYWPVSAAGALAERMAEWKPGDAVVVVGTARPLADPPRGVPQVEIWARSAGPELNTREHHPLPPGAAR